MADTTKDKKDLRLEILEQIASLSTAGFGLVAALAWNDAIKSLFTRLFPQPGGNFWAQFLYAVVITIIVVVITFQLGRMVSGAKQRLGK
jgi:uncharacterized membrane protein (DUF4010 family)